MKVQAPRMLTVVLCLALAACQGGTDSGEAAGEPLVLQAAMRDVIESQSQAVVNILIGVLDDQGDVDPTKLTDADWETMETAATALRGEVDMLRASPIQVVAAPGDRLFEQDLPGMSNAVQVQARIDADLEGFRAHFDDLSARAEEWLTAIAARDAASMWRVALDLDPSCTECHEVFWTGEPEHEDEDESR